MEIDQTLQISTSFLELLTAIIGVPSALIGLRVAYVKFKKMPTQDNNTKRKRLLENTEVIDRNLEKHLDEIKDFEAIRKRFPRINFPTLKHAKNLLKWMSIKHIGFHEANKFSEGFVFNRKNPKDIKFETPQGTTSNKRINHSLAIMLFTLISLLLLVAPYSGLDNTILIKTKISDKLLFINKNRTIEASSFFIGEKWIADTTNCNALLTEKKLDQKEINAFCDLIENQEKIDSYFNYSKRETLITLAIMLPILLIGFIYFILEKNKLEAIMKFEKEINDNNVPQ